MALDSIKELKHNASQGVTYDTVMNRIGTLSNNNLKVLLLSIMGKAENIVPIGLGITWVSALTVKVNKGILAQYVDDLEMMLAIEPADSTDIALSTAHATLDRVDIIQAKVERVADNTQSFNIWDGSNVVPSSATVDYKTKITLAKKDGTAGTGMAATPDSGYIKIAEITVRAASTNLDINDIKDIYAQGGWTSPQPIYIDRHNYSIRADLTQLRIDFEAYVQALKAFSVSDNTTKKSTKIPLDLNPSINTSFAGYLKSNPFVNDYLSDGKPRYGSEYLAPKQFYLDDYNFWRCEDIRIKMKGGWYKDPLSDFYTCYKTADTLYITFQGTGLLLFVKTDAVSTDSLQIEVDDAVATSQDLNNAISINDSSIIKIAEGLSDGIHTAKIYLNEDKKFSWSGMIILSPVTDDKVKINKGTHYILDSAVVFATITEIILNSYTSNGERDTVYISQDGLVEVGSGTSVGLTTQYGGSTDHSLEEITFNMTVLNYLNLISKIDNWTGIFATTDFETADDAKTYITTLNTASTAIELRFFGTGIDIDALVSAGNITWSLDGVAQTAITPTANVRQVVKLCSNLTYGSHIIRLAFATVGATVDVYQALIYRPKSVYDVNFTDKMALTTINRTKAGCFKNYHLDQLALLAGSNWSKVIENVNYPAGIILQNTNLAASQTMEFWFIGTRFTLYGNKNVDLGRFNITVDTTTFTNVDEYAASPAYNVPIWDSSNDGTLVLAYGIHKVVITTNNSKNGSSTGYNLQFGAIAVELPNAWLDYEYNPFASLTEKSRQLGVSQTFKQIEKEKVEEHNWNKSEHNKIISSIEVIDTALFSAIRQAAYSRFLAPSGVKGLFECIWDSATQLRFKPIKIHDIMAMGGITNKGKLIYKQGTGTASVDDELLDFSTVGNRLDGFAIQTNSHYAIFMYADLSGNVKFGAWKIPYTTLSTAIGSTVNTLDINQSVDEGLLFNENANLVIFQDATHFETPYGIYAASFSFHSSKDNLRVANKTATQLTLAENVMLATGGYSTASKVYQVNNYKPFSGSTGNLASVIDSDLGWLDTGIRIITDGSGNIEDFVKVGNKVFFKAGTVVTEGCADSRNAIQHLGAVNRLLFCPPDKTISLCNINVTNSSRAGHKLYFESGDYRTTSYHSDITTYSTLNRHEIEVMHGLIKPNNYSLLYTYEIGYEI